MASNILIKRRIGGAQGTPVALAAGELAYNDQGNHALDPLAGGALFIGGGASVVNTLVSASRQVEVVGDQAVAGKKDFTGDFGVGATPGVSDYRFPQARGVAGQVLRLNAGADALEFVASSAATTLSSEIPNGGTGTVEGNFNAVVDWSVVPNSDQTTTMFTVAAGELWIFNDLESGQSYMWHGGTGTYGTAAGGTPAIAADFSAVGAATRYATAAEVQAGTIADKAIAPNVAATDLFRTQLASGVQIVKPVAEFHGNMDLGFKLVSPITVEAHMGSTIRGQNLTTDILLIDNAQIDGGIF